MPLDDMRRQLERKAAGAATRTAADVEARLRRTGPTDTGNLAAKTTARSKASPRGATIDIIVDTPYAHIVAGGQRPHQIPSGGRRKYLHNARTGFSAMGPVNHPGAQGNSWWADTIRDLPDILARNWHGVR